MKTVFYNNLANAIVVFRVLLIFAAMIMLNHPSGMMRLLGVAVIVLAVLLDWVDGYVAQRCRIASAVGGLLDTLGDRITENLLFVFFSWKQVLPLYVPLFFLTRSFLSDFIRSLNFQKGFTTFQIHSSVWGRRLVSSRTSRVLYLCIKVLVFVFAGLALVAHSMTDVFAAGQRTMIGAITADLAAAAVVFSFCRFWLLVFDSREVLKGVFGK